MVHFDASVLDGESPVYGRSGLVSFCLQGRNFTTEGLFIGNAPAQDSPPQDAEFDLCHIEPTAVFGSVVKLQTPGDAPGFSGREGLVERSRFMGVEIVQHHPYPANN